MSWRDMCELILFWSEVSYVEVHRNKSTMHIRVTLCWGYLIVLWLFYLVCILYCDCFNLFCNCLVCTCVGFVMCGCVRVCMYGCFGNMCTCIYCVFVLFRLCVFILFMLLFNIVSYVFYCYVCLFLLLYMFFSVYPPFIRPADTPRLPWLTFFSTFSSVLRQMSGYNWPRRGTTRTLPN